MLSVRQPSPSTFHVPHPVHIVIPYLIPPTVNHYKKPIQKHLRDGSRVQSFAVTPEAQAFKDAVAIFAHGQTIAPQLDSQRRTVRYRLDALIVLGAKQRGDGDNFWKCLADGLTEAGVIHSDARVSVWNLELDDQDRHNPRTEITASLYVRPA